MKWLWRYLNNPTPWPANKVKPFRSILARFVTGAGLVSFLYLTFFTDNIGGAILALFGGGLLGVIIEMIHRAGWVWKHPYGSFAAKLVQTITILVTGYFLVIGKGGAVAWTVIGIIFLGGIWWAWAIEDKYRHVRLMEKLNKGDAERRRREMEEEQWRKDAPLRMEKELAELKKQIWNLQAGGASGQSSAELEAMKAKLKAAEERARRAEQKGAKNEKFMTMEAALELFELPSAYTAAELKKRRMDLLKKVHPDTGGSNMMAKMVNEAYELLKSKI